MQGIVSPGTGIPQTARRQALVRMCCPADAHRSPMPACPAETKWKMFPPSDLKGGHRLIRIRLPT
ncbi:hypothetical cytosolic protein [Syntrophus aciditrophicus SB]|uniref:Hypothetical cytosolic protein n=1 Tax=Syntrophus aciditrophicus (strain SB) TaxID=56780 RepID=Q2LYB2_SYNAS|nr:hypothetical cytosolic protein [Syntrophus aciditrophicus SB]